MMGGSGGGRYDVSMTDTIRRRLEQSRQQELERLDSDVNALLQRILAEFNDRDTEKTASRLESIDELLGSEVELERILLGGSVAKHTDVDGLSDVDALVIMKREEVHAQEPRVVLETFRSRLDEALPRHEVESIERGRIAVTITYRDGSQVQLLPATRSGGIVSIPSADGSSWIETNPRTFRDELTRQNARLNRSLIPAIKLAKALIHAFPEKKRLSGYHVEALALDAARGYEGPFTGKSVLLNLLDHASSRVLKPIRDATGQSNNVDAYLGGPNSVARNAISQTLEGMRKRLAAATTVQEWEAAFGN